MNLNPERKIKYVKATEVLLERAGVENLTIRKVAREVGCTSAVLYKHFVNKEHLVMLASIKFLEPYILELMRLSKLEENLSPIQVDLILWRKFIEEAFKNKKYYLQCFYGDQKEMLEDYIFEYYEMFPEKQREIDGLTASILFSGNLQEREGIRLRRAASMGLITYDNANILARLTTSVFNGIFMHYCTENIDVEENSLNLVVDDCYNLIYALFEKFVKPGTVLTTTEPSSDSLNNAIE